jgi:hypothetical protein
MQNIIFSIKLEGINIPSNQTLYYTEYNKETLDDLVGSKLITDYCIQSVNYSIRDNSLYAEGIAEYNKDDLEKIKLL